MIFTNNVTMMDVITLISLITRGNIYHHGLITAFANGFQDPQNQRPDGAGVCDGFTQASIRNVQKRAVAAFTGSVKTPPCNTQTHRTQDDIQGGKSSVSQKPCSEMRHNFDTPSELDLRPAHQGTLRRHLQAKQKVATSPSMERSIKSKGQTEKGFQFNSRNSAKIYSPLKGR